LVAATVLFAVTGLASTAAVAQETPPAESAVAAASLVCGKSSELIYQPPLDLIRLAAKRLNEQGKQYQREVKIVATVGEDGLVREVQMASSSGHRLLDVAIRNWATGQMFAPQDCGPADRYFVRIPVIVAGGTMP
jgi:outer membrane biosynthesis protein TonB